MLMFHWCVSGISRAWLGNASVCRAVCGPGVNTNPNDGSARLRTFGRVVNASEIALGGFVRMLAPPCEKADWTMRPWNSPYPPRITKLPDGPALAPSRPLLQFG